MRILMTGGPTHEYLDEVRFFGNASSGRMAFELSRAAQARGHEVTLILGPTGLEAPAGLAVVPVISAREMHAEVLARLSSAEVFIGAAAVADFRPKFRHNGKIKKGVAGLVVELVKNPDILAEVGTMAAGRLVVGFALEAAPPAEALALAREKLVRKRCDLVVLNRTRSLGHSHGEDVVLVTRTGEEPLGNLDKSALATRIVAWCEARIGPGDGGVRGLGERGDERIDRGSGASP